VVKLLRAETATLMLSLLLVGCNDVSFGGDPGTIYRFHNLCAEKVIVRLVYGERVDGEIAVAVNGHESLTTLDRPPLDATFRVLRSDRTGSVTFNATSSNFDLQNERCPTS